jgi:arylsulfatase A-like enzyme
MKKIFNYTVMILVVLASFSCGSNSEKGEKRVSTVEKNIKPNILFIFADDLGYHDLSSTGSKIYQTPNIDNLAKESVTFTNAYANYPRCVPSRFAAWTGTYPIKDGDVPDDGFVMSDVPNSNNIIKLITRSGYQTAFFGKWHLGGKDTGTGPLGFGFDTSVMAGHAGSPISYIYPFNTPKWTKKKSKKSPIIGLEGIAKEGDYLTDVMTNQVVNYIENRDKNKPFMAILAYYAVHQPLEAKKEDVDRNKKEIKSFDYGNQPEYIKEGTGRTKMRQDNAKYAGMVENMDMNIGKLLQLLKDQGIEDNTIVIFSSDHGGLSNDGTKKRDLATSNYPLRAGKGWLYDGGIKVPLFVKWNNHLKPHEDKESIVMLMDVLPTLLDITEGKKVDVDGQSILPVLKENETWDDRTVYWHSSKARPRSTGDTKSSAIREGKYKLINWYKEGRTELYDINKDPGEQKDLSRQMPEKTKELLNKLNMWKSEF